MKEKKISLAIVDDQSLFRQGIVSLINDVEDLEITIEAASGKELEDLLSKAVELPDILLMDMKLDDTTGLELNAIIQTQYPSIKVLVLSMYAQERIVFRMIESGACGYIAKNCDKDELLNAIHSTIKSGFYFNQISLSAMRHAASHINKPILSINAIPIELSMRENEILQLICQEHTNVEIAEKLFISARTVDGHRNNLLAKTGCKNTAGLVVFAIKNNIFQIVQ